MKSYDAKLAFERLEQYRCELITSQEVRDSKLKRASILVPLYVSPESGELCVLLTLRSSRLKSHPGEVCLPGGKEEFIDDKDPVKTAIRECQEETGLGPDQITKGK